MRRWLSLLLIAFLVLRGLVGSAMAAGMPPPTPTPATPMHAAHEAHAQTPSVQDACQQAAHHPPEHCSAESGGTHGSACTSCTICHTALAVPAMASAATPGPLAFWHGSTPLAVASAPLAPAYKPPIG